MQAESRAVVGRSDLTHAVGHGSFFQRAVAACACCGRWQAFQMAAVPASDNCEVEGASKFTAVCLV